MTDKSSYQSIMGEALDSLLQLRRVQ